MPADTVDLVSSSPASDVDSFVFDSSSDGVHTPDQRSPARPTFDAAKGIASVGVTVHSPPARFVGTPFTTGSGNSLFEYPFPATRPALSNVSSMSSVASSLLGPPSPSTRAKYIPRLSQRPSKRRVSGGGAPQIRIPPRLRTDSDGSMCSNASQPGEDSGSTSTPTSSRTLPPPRPLLSHSRLRDRSGSLGVLPISLPPPNITTVGVGAPSAGPMSPAALVGAMTTSGLAAHMIMTPVSDCDADESESEAISFSSGKRRASVPAMFAPRLDEVSDSDSGLDREDVEDFPDPSPLTPQGTTQ